MGPYPMYTHHPGVAKPNKNLWVEDNVLIESQVPYPTYTCHPSVAKPNKNLWVKDNVLIDNVDTIDQQQIPDSSAWDKTNRWDYQWFGWDSSQYWLLEIASIPQRFQTILQELPQLKQAILKECLISRIFGWPKRLWMVCLITLWLFQVWYPWHARGEIEWSARGLKSKCREQMLQL